MMLCGAWSRQRYFGGEDQRESSPVLRFAREAVTHARDGTEVMPTKRPSATEYCRNTFCATHPSATKSPICTSSVKMGPEVLEPSP